MNLQLMIYEWLQTAEVKREEALEEAFARTKKQPKDMQAVYGFLVEVVRHREFKDIQSVLYDLIK